MTDLHDRELADEIDREVQRSGRLYVLTLCLSAAIAATVAGVAITLGLI